MISIAQTALTVAAISTATLALVSTVSLIAAWRILRDEVDPK